MSCTRLVIIITTRDKSVNLVESWLNGKKQKLVSNQFQYNEINMLQNDLHQAFLLRTLQFLIQINFTLSKLLCAILVSNFKNDIELLQETKTVILDVTANDNTCSSTCSFFGKKREWSEWHTSMDSKLLWKLIRLTHNSFVLNFEGSKIKWSNTFQIWKGYKTYCYLEIV